MFYYYFVDGVIMESGALDGKLLSISYMFEMFANWTAIHVGISINIYLTADTTSIRLYS